MTKAFRVLFTRHITKKRKTYRDGTVVLVGNNAVLRDDNDADVAEAVGGQKVRGGRGADGGREGRGRRGRADAAHARKRKCRSWAEGDTITDVFEGLIVVIDEVLEAHPDAAAPPAPAPACAPPPVAPRPFHAPAVVPRAPAPAPAPWDPPASAAAPAPAPWDPPVSAALAPSRSAVAPAHPPPTCAYAHRRSDAAILHQLVGDLPTTEEAA